MYFKTNQISDSTYSFNPLNKPFKAYSSYMYIHVQDLLITCTVPVLFNMKL